MVSMFERAAHLVGGIVEKLDQYDAGPSKAVGYIKKDVAKRTPHLVLPDRCHHAGATADFSGSIKYKDQVLVYSGGRLVDVDPEEPSSTMRLGGAGGGRGG